MDVKQQCNNNNNKILLEVKMLAIHVPSYLKQMHQKLIWYDGMFGYMVDSDQMCCTAILPDTIK